MAYTTINKSGDYFNTVTYTGNGSTQNITGVGFQPDLVWAKRRSADGWHFWTDAVRGAGKAIYSNNTDAEFTDTDNSDINSFLTDGFSVGNNADINGNGQTHVGWNWLGANGTASNTDGSITSTVSANTTSGFSIVKYTGNDTAGATVGHGLGAVPKMIIVKRYTDVRSWPVYHHSLGNSNKLYLDLNYASASSTNWNSTTPDSSVFTISEASDVNGGGGASDYIAYCFADIKGFSKFGSYTGNGNADGSFIYTGFKPAFLIVKRTDDIGGFKQFDNKRNTFNSLDKNLSADSNSAEDSGSDRLDFLSNGFKIRTTSGAYGGASGGSYIYMAFAEAPLVGTNNVPCTAR